MKALLSKPLAALAVHKQKQWSQRPVATQLQVLRQLIYQARNTHFGKEHQLGSIKTYEAFKERVPIRDYESIAPYIQQIQAGERDVLWPGKPMYWAKTSGTTSGSKYIPITKASLPHHIAAARNALFYYIHETGNASFLNGKMLFLSGSPQLEHVNDIPTGRLSGIVHHHVPSYLSRNHCPSYATNCIPDWEQKLDAIIQETKSTDLTLLSGIPPWVQMYLEKLQQHTGKQAKELFPNFSLLVHGGVDFAPYRTKLFDTIGEQVDTIETYPASEGFIAFQDSQQTEGLLLLLNSGMFFEFIPVSEYFSDNPTRLWIQEVELGVDYAIILSTNAGLWAYTIGDTVKFVSKDPHRIVVTGRIKHFTSAFGEHVIAKEVDQAMQYALDQHPEAVLVEFTVAPQVGQQAGDPSYHEWFIEFTNPPQDLASFAQALDQAVRKQNAYYDDLIRGSILQPLKITSLPRGSFQQYMQLHGKLGGQNKVVRLANDRIVAEALLAH